MSPTASPSVFRRLAEPRVLNHLIMTAAGFATYALLFASNGNDLGAAVAFVLAVAGILLRWTAAPILILLFTAYLHIDPGFGNLLGQVTGSRWFWQRTSAVFQLEDLLLAGGFLVYVIGHYRLAGMLHQAMPDEPTVRRDVDMANPPKRPTEIIADDEWVRALVVAAGCLVGGQAAWLAIRAVVARLDSSRSEFSEGTLRLILFTWLVVVGLCAVAAILVYARTLRMSRHEAKLILRDQFFHETRRETDRLHRWRQWFKRRVATDRRAGK